MVDEQISAIDAGFRPDAAVSGAVLLQSEYSAFLIFNAVKRGLASQKFESAGSAVCEFVECSITKFGYPNDEAWSAIPRSKGLSYGIWEVARSRWASEITDLNKHAFPATASSSTRHFLLLFHDSSFECLARDMRSELTNEPLTAVLSRLTERIAAK